MIEYDVDSEYKLRLKDNQVETYKRNTDEFGNVFFTRVCTYQINTPQSALLQSQSIFYGTSTVSGDNIIARAIFKLVNENRELRTALKFEDAVNGKEKKNS